METKQSQKTKETSRFWWVTGARHVIISRRAVFQVMVIVIGLLAGSIAAERFRLKHNSSRLRDSKGAMKGTNLRLKAEKDDYKNLFKQMAEQLEEWKSTGEHDQNPEKQKTHMHSFKEMSEALMIGLDDVRTVLEEKEFQLWEKEGLLEYQEERLLDSEDQEVQMALYINLLAQHMIALNLTLPKGLEEQPYQGVLITGVELSSPLVLYVWQLGEREN
uniref:Uncharacterized protein n=1 Tax=Aureoumbra lagunensis TaxID=44058 RepID=A0A7S3NPH2_9STRA|mmetsp:Transcript_21019/g.25273  ORF Transcript_21019/g.25273 Transcript_21019/m.25273 type:complete len:218 (-) Transcript_21019:446-1099(-)